MANRVAAQPYGTPTAGALVGEDRRAGISWSYAVLALVHLLFGILFLAFPYLAAHAFFATKDHDDFRGIELLLRLFSTLFFTGATLAWALKNASDNGTILNGEALRLKSGLVILAPLIVLLHLLYIKQLSIWGLLLGAIAMLATLLVPLVTLGLTDVRLLGWNNIVQGVTSGVRTLFDAPTTFRSAASFLFALSTLVFVVAGVAYLVAPHYTLRGVFGYGKGLHAALLAGTSGERAAFLWRCLGVGLLTAAPTITYVLKDAADNGYLGESVPTTLNAGLIVTSIVHLSIFIYMMVTQRVRWMLLSLTVTWGLALVAAIIGMLVANSSTAREALGSGYEQV